MSEITVYTFDIKISDTNYWHYEKGKYENRVTKDIIDC